MSLYDEIGKALEEGRDPQEAVDAHEWVKLAITPEAFAVARAYEEDLGVSLPWTDSNGTPINIHEGEE